MDYITSPTKNPSTFRSRGWLFKCRHGPTFPLKQYHRPHRLNGRVRNGNGCCPVGMGTDKASIGTVHPDESRFTFRHSIPCPSFVVCCSLYVVALRQTTHHKQRTIFQ